MSTAARLEREAEVLCRYLLGVRPTAGVVASYVEAHRVRPGLEPRAPFDPVPLRLAIAGWFPTRVCDAYARIVQPRGLLRRKLSLLLAILESSPGVYERVESVDSLGRGALVTRLAGRLALSALALLAGLLLLAPPHALTRLIAMGFWQGRGSARPPVAGGE